MLIQKILEKYNKPEELGKELGMFAKLRELISRQISKRKLKVDVGHFVKHYSDKLFYYIVHRRHLKFRTIDFFKYLLCCKFLKSKLSLRYSKSDREFFFLQKGELKLNNGKSLTYNYVFRIGYC